MSLACPAPTIVYHGDSITANGGAGLPNQGQSGTANTSYLAIGFPTWAQILTSHRLAMVGQVGIGGNTTSQILARIRSDVLPLRPGWVHDLSGTNDMTKGRLTLDQAKANKLAMWDLYDAAGIRVITGTIPPSGSYSADTRTDQDNLNAWLRAQAAIRPNLVLIDYHAYLTTPGSNGVYDVGLNMDATHPNTAGAAAMGYAFAQTVNQVVPPRPFLSNTQGDLRNLVTAGRFNLGGSAALPTSWSSPNLTGSAFTKTARTDLMRGSWQTVTVANGSSGSIQHNISVNGQTLAVGDIIQAAIEFQISGLDQAAAAQTQSFSLKLQWYNGTGTDLTMSPYWVQFSSENMPAWSRSGVLLTPPIAVPATSTLILMQVVMGGGGTYNLDRATCWNLSRPAEAATS